MTTTEQGQPVSLDYLAGRLDGQETQFQILQAGQQQIREEMIAGWQQIRAEMAAGQQQIRDEMAVSHQLIRADMNAGFAKIHALLDETDNILDAGLKGIREEVRELKAGQRQLMIANCTVGGIIAALVVVLWLVVIF